MWPLAILAALGVGYLVLKQPAIISAPGTGTPEERQANVLPANFEAWVRIASPRQIDAVRAITQYQLRALAVLRDDAFDPALQLPIDGQNTYAFRLALASEVFQQGNRSVASTT